MQSPRVSVDVALNFTSAQMGGGLSYMRGLVPHLVHADPKIRYVLFSGSHDLASERNLEVVHVRRDLLMRTLWEHLILPNELNKRRIDVLLAAGNQGPIMARTSLVLCVQNVDPLISYDDWPMSFRVKMTLLRVAMEVSAKKAKRIVAVSKYAAGLLATRFGIAPEKIQVVPHGAPEDVGLQPSEDVIATLNEIGIAKPFVLALSNVTYNKNHTALIRAFATVRQRLSMPLQLVIAGRIIHEWCLPEIRRAIEMNQVDAHVKWLGWASPELRRGLFAEASALVFPSTVESFGLPALEAMAYGLPVIASKIPAIEEVCGEAAVYVPPEDPDGIAAGMASVLLDEALRKRMILVGRNRAAQFNWRESARQTLDVLKQAASA